MRTFFFEIFYEFANAYYLCTEFRVERADKDNKNRRYERILERLNK